MSNDFFDEVTDSIFEADCFGNILYRNQASIDTFGKFKNFSSVKHLFDIDTEICLLNDISVSFPDLMFESDENFHSCCSYQTNEGQYLNFSVFAQKSDKGKLILFKKSNNSESIIKVLEEKNKNLSNLLKKDNKLKEKAEKLALESALLNRIFAKIRNTREKSEVIKMIVEEIHTLLGAYKTRYVSLHGKKTKVEFVYPANYSSETGKKSILDEDTLKYLLANKLKSSLCSKDELFGNEPPRKGSYKVVIPITDGQKTIGAIVSFTVHKDVLSENTGLLQTLSTQLAGVIIRTELTENLNKQNKKLAKALKELNETSLNLINTEKLASIGQLVAGVAHEINTPLASVSSNNDIMKKLLNSGKFDKDIALKLIQTDREAVKRISEIVKSLKKFVRLDEAEVQPADINKEIDLTLTLIKHETKNKAQIVKNYGKLPLINCYVNMLNQVFMNLLVNAAQSIKDKGIVTITTRMLKKSVKISIKDTGCGIKEKDKEKIFKTGFTTKGPGVGTGLGLAICHKIIEKHHGKITFKSRENEGTEFVIRIPVK